MTQDAPQKNIATAGSVRMPTTTFVLWNLACRRMLQLCAACIPEMKLPSLYKSIKDTDPQASGMLHPNSVRVLSGAALP